MGKGPAPAGLKIVVSSFAEKAIPSFGTVMTVSFSAGLSSSACAPVPMRRAMAPARKIPAIARTASVDEISGDLGMDEFSSSVRFA